MGDGKKLGWGGSLGDEEAGGVSIIAVVLLVWKGGFTMYGWTAQIHTRESLEDCAPMGFNANHPTEALGGFWIIHMRWAQTNETETPDVKAKNLHGKQSSPVT